MAASPPSLHQLEKYFDVHNLPAIFNNVPNVNEILPSIYVESLSTLSWYVLT